MNNVSSFYIGSIPNFFKNSSYEQQRILLETQKLDPWLVEVILKEVRRLTKGAFPSGCVMAQHRQNATRELKELQIKVELLLKESLVISGVPPILPRCAAKEIMLLKNRQKKKLTFALFESKQRQIVEINADALSHPKRLRTMVSSPLKKTETLIQFPLSLYRLQP
jgi:hypothetical protein